MQIAAAPVRLSPWAGRLGCTWQNEGTPEPGGRGPGTFQYTGGTGKYKGISGNNTFVGITQVNWRDGYAIWNR